MEKNIKFFFNQDFRVKIYDFYEKWKFKKMDLYLFLCKNQEQINKIIGY